MWAPLCWRKLSEIKVVGPNLIREIEEKVKVIKDHLKAVSDKQKSYAKLKIKDISYNDSENVFLKVSPLKKVLLFCEKGKLSLKFIESYEIIECICPMAYRLTLPPNLERIYNCFPCVNVEKVSIEPLSCHYS